jgi:hypothetical protein
VSLGKRRTMGRAKIAGVVRWILRGLSVSNNTIGGGQYSRALASRRGSISSTRHTGRRLPILMLAARA